MNDLKVLLMNQLFKGSVNEWMNELFKGSVNEWMNYLMVLLMNEWFKGCFDYIRKPYWSLYKRCIENVPR